MRLSQAEQAPATGSGWVRREHSRERGSSSGPLANTPRGGPRITLPLLLLPCIRSTSRAAVNGSHPALAIPNTREDVGPKAHG